MKKTNGNGKPRPKAACPICGVSFLLSTIVAHMGSSSCILQFARNDMQYHHVELGPRARKLSQELLEVVARSYSETKAQQSSSAQESS